MCGCAAEREHLLGLWSVTFGDSKAVIIFNFVHRWRQKTQSGMVLFSILLLSEIREHRKEDIHVRKNVDLLSVEEILQLRRALTKLQEDKSPGAFQASQSFTLFYKQYFLIKIQNKPCIKEDSFIFVHYVK